MSFKAKIVAGGFLVLFSTLAFCGQEDSINLITENIVKVCDKPENAGKYWDIKVKGDGEASIKLKLANLGVTGNVEFTKGEWEGIQRTVEDNKDYRDCVKVLSQLFVEKFAPIIQIQGDNVPKEKVLGGVMWQEFGQGVSITLKSCSRKSTSVICIFIANAVDADVKISIFGDSAIYDQIGNKFLANYISIANFKSAFQRASSESRGELVKGVDTEIAIRFSGVDSKSTLVSKAMIDSYIQAGNSSDRHTFSFRNIKLLIN